jgi:hypothetical protein
MLPILLIIIEKNKIDMISRTKFGFHPGDRTLQLERNHTLHEAIKSTS